MAERIKGRLPICRTLPEVERYGPYQLITLFETIEHLSVEERSDFLAFADRNLTATGSLLISAPIEIGPALILKDLNRFAFRLRRSEHHMLEFFKAAVFGIPARRAEAIKDSHRGFDFRETLAQLRIAGWECEVLRYGPLLIPTWYGNSQVYIAASRGRRDRSKLYSFAQGIYIWWATASDSLFLLSSLRAMRPPRLRSCW
jgi:hypothetical protein